MHDQPNHTPAEEERRADAAVLNRLLSAEVRAPVSVDELVRAIGDRVAVIDSLARLYGAGLVHRCAEFTFATQAARRFDELSG